MFHLSKLVTTRRRTWRQNTPTERGGVAVAVWSLAMDRPWPLSSSTEPCPGWGLFPPPSGPLWVRKRLGTKKVLQRANELKPERKASPWSIRRLDMVPCGALPPGRPKSPERCFSCCFFKRWPPACRDLMSFPLREGFNLCRGHRCCCCCCCLSTNSGPRECR